MDFTAAEDGRGINIEGGSGRGAVLAGFDVSATGTDLAGADLTGARLGDMTGTSLVSADLTGATLAGGLDHADLTGAAVDDVTVLDSVRWNMTTCPDGTLSNDNFGACPIG